MKQLQNSKARVASVIAATAVSLACGTNYAYSAWGPEFAERMEFSATQANVIGSAGNVGAYAMGVPAGLIVDSRGPRLGVFIGALCLGLGYMPIHQAYDRGPGSMSLGVLSFCSFLTGTGSCIANTAAIKTATFNWPNHRGTASAIPLAAFGLSAFVFTTIANVAFGDSISGYLLLLALGTMFLQLGALLFIRLIPTLPQNSVPLDLHRIESDPTSESNRQDDRLQQIDTSHPKEDEELLSRSSMESDAQLKIQPYHENMKEPDITGLRTLITLEFWQLFAMLALLSGVGIMTINNIGNDAGALWRKFDSKATEVYIQKREQIHVAILSVASFAGRLVSGVGSDFLVKRMHASRLWCLIGSGLVFVFAQFLALTISNPNLLFLVSVFTGMAYGALFGVFPALVADAFGVSGLSLNWGFVIFAPVVSANIFNLAYGRIFDANSEVVNIPPKEGSKPGRTEMQCLKGINCYRSAYWLTLTSCCTSVVLGLSCIKYQQMKRRRAAAQHRGVLS